MDPSWDKEYIGAFSKEDLPTDHAQLDFIKAVGW